MKILLVNDDGVAAPGLLAMRSALLGAGHEVCVVAPDSERSASSHAITFLRPIRARERHDESGDIFAIDGTPTDCTRFGLREAFPQAQFVVSGINPGANVGRDTLYSGTVAAAMEAAMYGVPAMAVSVDWAPTQTYDAACVWAVKMLEHFRAHPLPGGQMCNLNVPNVPPEQIRGLRLAELDDTSNVSEFEKFTTERTGNWYFTGVREQRVPAPGSDRALLDEGYASATYLSWRLSVDAPPDALPL